MSECKICGEENCKEHSFLIGKPVSIKEFSGSSPPEVFIGRWNYPNVYAGILSPQSYGNTQIMSSPELWHENKLPIPNILELRSNLIYGRSTTNIKNPSEKFMETLKEVAMTHRSISTEFQLKKPITKQEEQDPKVPLISKAAEVSQVRLQENPHIKPKVEYLVNDTDLKSSPAIIELDKSGIDTSSIIKILSAGLLGLKKNRKLVPTRWAITATDDTLSKERLKQIRQYQELQEIQVFHAEYLGNNYNFLLLPDKFSFEVIEISLKSTGVWQDFEGFSGRKTYADSVTGAYYVNRLALTEYLTQIKRQCNCLVLREVRPEYYAPLGVGILRQISRDAFSKPAKKFNTIQEALDNIQTRLKIPIKYFTEKSVLLKNYKTQQRLSDFF